MHFDVMTSARNDEPLISDIRRQGLDAVSIERHSPILVRRHAHDEETAAETLDIESGVANIETLKHRRRGIVQQGPLPDELLSALDRAFDLRRRQRDPDPAADRLWGWSRTTAWRRVKEVMAAAGITGSHATPRDYDTGSA